MVLFPNCKINLGLNVIRKRNDGFHDLETVFYPIPLQDALEVIQTGELEEREHFTMSGVRIESRNEDNLCIKAIQLLKKDFPQIQECTIHLHKVIPPGAGLGGGSSDAAFTLKLLNQIFTLGLSIEKLIDYALQLGSDCPFFILNKPCYATGRGEILQPLILDLSANKLVLVNPGIHINTTEAFSLLNPVSHSKSIREVIQQPMETWRYELKNDFEEPIFKKYPEVKKIKDDLYKIGAIYVAMSGSGSTVYGIFNKDETAAFSFPPNYFVWELAG